MNGESASQRSPATSMFSTRTEFAIGTAGSNVLYVDPENDLVVVARWIGPVMDESIKKVLGSQ